VAHTGRVITAAALIMAISFAALMAARVSFMRLFGFGLTVAVLVDATLVRNLLVPALMHVLGRANWWVPKPLARVHDRLGRGESAGRASDSENELAHRRWRALAHRVLFGQQIQRRAGPRD
jgi:RND superfamily putative drug exporter